MSDGASERRCNALNTWLTVRSVVVADGLRWSAGSVARKRDTAAVKKILANMVCD